MLIDTSVALPALLAVIGLVTYLIKLGMAYATMQGDITGLKRDVTFIQDALYRRAGVEVVHKGWGKLESPIKLGAIAINAVMPLLATILPFYLNLLKQDPQITDQDVFWKLEQKFGDMIVEKLCIPHGLSSLGCLVAVLETCKLARTEGGPKTCDTA